jgi:hypothetical protein
MLKWRQHLLTSLAHYQLVTTVSHVTSLDYFPFLANFATTASLRAIFRHSSAPLFYLPFQHWISSDSICKHHHENSRQTNSCCTSKLKSMKIYGTCCQTIIASWQRHYYLCLTVVAYTLHNLFFLPNANKIFSSSVTNQSTRNDITYLFSPILVFASRIFISRYCK